jgi:hypothetical protein
MQRYTLEYLKSLTVAKLKILAKKEFGLFVEQTTKIQLIIQILRKQQGYKIVGVDDFFPIDYQNERDKLEKLILLETTDIDKIPKY